MNANVISVFNSELATLNTLNNGLDRQTYPHINRNKEQLFRNQFVIGNDEIVLYIQEIEDAFPNEQYDVLGLVVTDKGIRMAYADPMNITFIAFDNHTSVSYNTNTNCLEFDDENIKVSSPQELHLSFFFNSNDSRYLSKKTGDFIANLLQRMAKETVPDSSADLRRIYNNYVITQKSKEDEAKKKQMKSEIEKSQVPVDKFWTDHIASLVIMAAWIIINIYWFATCDKTVQDHSFITGDFERTSYTYILCWCSIIPCILFCVVKLATLFSDYGKLTSVVEQKQTALTRFIASSKKETLSAFLTRRAKEVEEKFAKSQNPQEKEFTLDEALNAIQYGLEKSDQVANILSYFIN